MDRGTLIGLIFTGVTLAGGVVGGMFAMQATTHGHYREVQAKVSGVFREDAVWKKGVEGELDELRRVLCTYPQYSGHLECP